MCKVSCPLCKGENLEFLTRFSNRDYYECIDCALAFVPPYDHLLPEDELARYDKHNNTADEPGYVRYLEEVSGYVTRVPVNNPKILDFGCYKTQVLGSILRKMGLDCDGYDPCYNIGLPEPGMQYDLLILCEVIEHLNHIDKEIDLIKSLLKDDTGYLLIRTELYSSDKDIKKWWYTNDETHIFMPSEHTITLIGEMLNREVFYSDGKRYMILGPVSRKI